MKKPFWKKPAKSKKKHKPQISKPKHTHKAIPKSPPTPWIPPHPKRPTDVEGSVNDGRIIKAPVTYKIPSESEVVNHQLTLPPPSGGTDFARQKRQAQKEFLDTFRKLTGRWRSWDIWTDFITMAACAISNSVDKSHYEEREKRYLEVIGKYSIRERELFVKLFAHVVLALEENPEQDFLGDIYTELGLNSKEHKQHFTPYNVCHFMAELTLGDLVTKVKGKGVVEVHDCCCGAGATLIAASNVAKSHLEKDGIHYQNHVLITGQDIDYLVTMMCYIQISLLGMAGYFKVGNALTDPMADGDSLDNYWFTPMYFFPVWHYRRIWHSMDKLFGGEKDE